MGFPVNFLAKARLAPAKTWENVLHSRENCQKEYIGVTSVLFITFACSGFAGPDLDLGSISVQGYVHGHEHIWLGSFKHCQ